MGDNDNLFAIAMVTAVFLKLHLGPVQSKAVTASVSKHVFAITSVIGNVYEGPPGSGAANRSK